MQHCVGHIIIASIWLIFSLKANIKLPYNSNFNVYVTHQLVPRVNANVANQFDCKPELLKTKQNAFILAFLAQLNEPGVENSQISGKTSKNRLLHIHSR